MNEPNLYVPTSQLVTRRQLNQAPARRWSDEMQVPLTITRKTWERIFVIQALASRGRIREGQRGLGFGVGADPMIPAMVNHGCELVATDYGDSELKGWGPDLELDKRGVARPDRVARQVTQRNVDMNDIPSDLQDFDYVYSCGSLEHIGGLKHGFDFVFAAMDCLKPGGVAVHTTELNLSKGTDTLDQPALGFYRPKMVKDLFARLRAAGHSVEPMNYETGKHHEDAHIARRPFPAPCLKVWHNGYVVTSMGFVITAGPSGQPAPSRVSTTLRAASDVADDAVRAASRRIGRRLHDFGNR